MPEQFWFGRSARLMGILRDCTTTQEHPSGLLFFPGFGQTKAGPAFLFTTLSRRLSTLASAFQFDYRGWGDSEGDLSDCTVEGLLADAWDALAEYERRTAFHRLVIIGAGIGNWIAVQVASQQKNAALVLTTPYRSPKPLSDVLGEPLYTQCAKENALVDTHMLGSWDPDSSITVLFKQLGAGKSRAKGVLLQWQLLVDLASLNVFTGLHNFSGPILEFYRPTETPLPITSQHQTIVLPSNDLSRKDPDPRNTHFLEEEISSWVFQLHKKRR